MEKIPRIGIEVLVLKSGRFLLLKRTGSHGEGTWCPPGGHLEFQESPEDCARREVREEAGIRIKNIRFAAVTNDIFSKEDKHYITIHMLADYESGEPGVMEKGKAKEIGWFEWEKLPQPLFLPMQNLLKQGFSPE
jgi:8-oxo-dGTP diphosphatase